MADQLSSSTHMLWDRRQLVSFHQITDIAKQPAHRQTLQAIAVSCLDPLRPAEFFMTLKDLPEACMKDTELHVLFIHAQQCFATK